MKRNNSLNSVNELDYISVENLEVLYNNIRKFFIDVHKVDIINYNSNIKEILFENMKLIYGTKFASSLKTKELNIITLQNIKKILEDEINKPNQQQIQPNQQQIQPNQQQIQPNQQQIQPNQQQNIDIIGRENNIYNRQNEDNKILPLRINESNNVNNDITINSKDISKFNNNYDNILLARNNEISKEPSKKVEFKTEKIEKVSSNDFNNNVDDLLAKREILYSEIEKKSESNMNANVPSTENLEGFSLNHTESNINYNINNERLSEPLEFPQNPQIEIKEKAPILKEQIIIISSSNRDLKEFPNSHNYTIFLKTPIENIHSIKLLNVLVNFKNRNSKNSIDYLILNLNNYDLLTSNNEKINNKFAVIYEGKKYYEEIAFTEPLKRLEQFVITLSDKYDKIPKIKENSKENSKENPKENLLEFLIKYSSN